MKYKLSLKFIALYIAIAATSFILISTLGSYLVEKWIVSNESISMYETASVIAEEYTGKSISSTSESDFFALYIITVKDDISVEIINNTGVVYMNTASGYQNDNKVIIEDFDPSYFNSGFYIIDDFFGEFESETLSVIVPITSNMSIRGYVALHKPMSAIYNERESFLSILHLVEIIILLLTVSLIIVMNFWIFRPVKKIIAGAHQIAAGNYESKIVIKQQDELGYLAETLNYMASELGKANEYQHKFISNVSHDFRSPLTSIKGYVEAIRDNLIPYNMKDKYLDIILSETTRLSKLTNELLSFDNIDNKLKTMSYTDFNINQLIRDSVLSFEMRCTQNNIKFNLALEGPELMVNADYGKIQQVIYNLIDNALKFSGNSSTIDIETTYKNNKVFVSIRDHGIGISSNDLPKIWTRFYKADSSRGKDKMGSGLGLSIVREIINSHNQKITVVSTEGVGTEFLFTLNPSDVQNEN